MEKAEKKTAAKKGDADYWERETDAAHEACSIFLTAEAFTTAAKGYFAACDAAGVLYGEAGLALYLSRHNDKGRVVTLKTLRTWYDGNKCPYLQDAVQAAYMEIMAQIETDYRYREKGGMATKAIFLLKQARLGGYQDRVEQKTDATVTIVHGPTMDGSDFE